jgi:hypothetical protein
MRVTRAILATLALAASSNAFAFTFPADEAWRPLLQEGEYLDDPLGDGAGNGRDIVGDATGAAIYVYTDGEALFVRMRVDVDPSAGDGQLGPYGWGLLIDTDADFTAYEYSLIADGIAEEIVFAENTEKETLGDPNDVAETLISGYPVPTDYADGGNIRLVQAPTSIDGTPDWFVDFAVSWADFVEAGLTDVPLYFVGGTSSSARSLSLDIAGCDDRVEDCDFSDGASDGTVLDDEPAGDTDTDGDGILDLDEDVNQNGDLDDDDSDGDGTADWLDPDDDGDGLPTGEEGTGDADEDGVPDYLDPLEDGAPLPDAVVAGGNYRCATGPGSGGIALLLAAALLARRRR